MLDVTEARRIILSFAQTLPAAATAAASALGRVLAEAVASDLDMPPFDKALMDGYAVRSADAGERVVIEEVGAGRTPTKPVGVGQATRIMTGAPLPDGADAVVPHEKTTLAGERVTLHVTPRAEQNILRRASEYAVGKVVLSPGTVLRPQEIGVLASVGRAEVRAVPPPRVAVIATGDELVEPPALPGPGQLRNSNAPMLVAQALGAGAAPENLGIARDGLDSLVPLIESGLRHDVVLLSGGVSAGKRDLVPEALAAMGVTAHFHKVSMKPGKPLLFGTRGATLVFGLPGNPVSSFVCFELFVRPALRRLAGHAELDLPRLDAALAADFAHDSDRPTFHPARLDGTAVRPTPWLGSADLSCLLAANALMELPAGARRYARGDAVSTLILGGR
ncbi:MAG: molybdopterin molybdotransferase MoeA [Gemmataceae bacterium]